MKPETELELRKARAIQQSNFEEIMDIIRPHIPEDRKNLVIELWAETITRIELAHWSEGYDAGYESAEKHYKKLGAPC
jgi:hypothetical protein